MSKTGHLMMEQLVWLPHKHIWKSHTPGDQMATSNRLNRSNVKNCLDSLKNYHEKWLSESNKLFCMHIRSFKALVTYLYYNGAQKSLWSWTGWLNTALQSGPSSKPGGTPSEQLRYKSNTLQTCRLQTDLSQPNRLKKCPVQLTCSSSWCSPAWTLLDTLLYSQGWDPNDERPPPPLCEGTRKEEVRDCRLSGVISWDLRCLHRTTLA